MTATVQRVRPGALVADGSRARVVAVGTAVPPTSYSQADLVDILGIENPKVRSLFLNSGIDRRFLTLPPRRPDGTRVPEEQGALLAKHKDQAVRMGAAAIRTCLRRAGVDLAEVRYLCCVTSTGLLTPGLSAHLIRALGLDRHISRIDVVGMGCNAGLNSLNVVAGWARAHPGQMAVMLCAEACSAAYVFDGSMRTSVVNSLFGDGAAAIALVAGERDRRPGPGPERDGPEILRFASCIVPEAIDAMRFDWDCDAARFSFFLDPGIPYVVGAHAELVVGRLLTGTGLRRNDIGHWLVHSGGKKVIDSVGVNLGLTRYDLRHTTGVLRDYGNLSSGSFLFSYERLLAEGPGRPGDYAVLMTMGPGSTLETALVQW